MIITISIITIIIIIISNNSKSFLKLSKKLFIDLNVPTGNIPTGQDILQQQFKELKDYTRHLEQEVEEYRKYIEERFNNINNQQFNVLSYGN